MMCAILFFMQKYRVGLVMGRFQTFHKGHLHLVTEALKHADELKMVIGSANAKDGKNPISLLGRRKIIRDVLREAGLSSKIVKIVGVPDIPSDEDWLKEVRKRTGHFDVWVGNNDWVKGIFEEAGIPVVEIDFHNRTQYEGTNIRRLIETGGEWEHLVPPASAVRTPRHYRLPRLQ